MITWKGQYFNELTIDELYKILKLRAEVFILEQNCPFLDCDDKDQQSFHLGGWSDGKLVAYVRLLPPGLAYEQPSIGRVCSSPSVRRTGIGKELMAKAVEQTELLFGKQPIKIGAQLYLKNFYQSFGFKQDGEIYLEDFIQHIHMVRP